MKYQEIGIKSNYKVLQPYYFRMTLVIHLLYRRVTS